MTLALFRLIEPASGAIIIDGEDISDIALYALRSKLTILPQVTYYPCSLKYLQQVINSIQHCMSESLDLLLSNIRIRENILFSRSECNFEMTASLAYVR